MIRKLFFTFIMVLTIHAISAPVWAGTADDDYSVANSYYMQKDYPRAFNAYQAAIPYDSFPYRAYLGMGNCEYLMDEKKKAIEYLQKSDDLNKDVKIETFIQKIKASIPPSKSGSFTKAETCLKNKQYQEAIPLLKEVEQYEPTNYKAFYDLGYCYYVQGDRPEAALNFAYYESKTKDSTVTSLVTKMERQLSMDDQDWLNDQLQLGPPFSPPFHSSGFGIRFEPTFQLTSLKDFNNFATEMQNRGGAEAQSDSSYAVTVGAPPGGLGIDLNPYLQVSEDLEVGLTFGTLFLGQFSATFSDLNSANDPDGNSSIAYQVIETGISVRVEPIKLYKNKIKFFVEADPSYYITGLTTANSEITSTTPNAGYDFPMVTGNFSSSGFGSRFKIGVDWKPIPNSMVSGFLGYQLAQIQGFTGSGSAAGGYSNVPVGSPVNMSGQLENLSGKYGTSIIFVPNGVNVPGATPLTLDLSGFIIGADFTILL